MSTSAKRLTEVAELRKQGKSYRYIAEQTGLAINSVRAYLWRARKAGLLEVVRVEHCPACGASQSRWERTPA